MDNKYIPLYRKYRPQTFHDLIGQENIVHALSNAIKLNRIAHAYLLCGPRGTGKTSSARILAKSLNCKEGPTLTPCGKCPACLDIMNSIPVDVIEIDAASNRSVEDTQAILEKIQYVPVNGRYKIYVIDEVHMLSNHAFNALLKTLEEPPENVIFILATTEPHKVLDTIISRCQRFDFRRITTDDIVKRLQYISEQENINITKEALYSIAKNSQGGMRDALALLDQISVLGINKQIDVPDVNEILGKISFDSLYEIVECIAESDCSKSVPLIDNIYSKGNEPVQIVTNLTGYFRDLMIVKNCSDKDLIYSLTQLNELNLEKTQEQAKKFSVSEIIQIIDRLAYYAVQIKETTNKYIWLELAIIDLTNYKNLPSAENLLKRIEVLERQIESGTHIQPQKVTTQAIQRPEFKETIKNTSPTQVSDVNSEKQSEKLVSPVPEVVNPEPQKEVIQNQKQEQPSDMHTLWVSILQSIDSPPNRAFYSNLSRPVQISEEKIVIAFSKEMFVKQAKEGAKKQALVAAVSKYMNIPNPNIEIIINDNLDLTKKTVITQPAPEKKEEHDLRKQEEEEYQAFVEAKEEEKNAPPVKPVDSSSQAAMVKELFDGKYIN
ncbi:MAG: DNA polymerase III subunit gamma/tau [Candidatus Gastranaerophilales bacterium]|nr:DNA polymerase III subunit gamma/tau [Candidatus Gastranaerophilales bacterium]